MFNVGDRVKSASGTEFIITEARGQSVTVTLEGRDYGRFHVGFFNLVTPAEPPTPKLTGMTQFFKDQKEKQQHETSI
jgi:hypothetical protein